jgi:hypothetical protein
MGESIRVESVKEVSDESTNIDRLGRKQGVKEWMDVVVRGEGMKMKEPPASSVVGSSSSAESAKKPRKRVVHRSKEEGGRKPVEVFGVKGIVERVDHVQSLLFSEDAGRLGSLKYSRELYIPIPVSLF